MAGVMRYDDFLKLPQPPAPRVIAYGPDPLQHVELWRPAGRGPFPVVLMLHGGCWQTRVAKADIMHAAAADLMRRGIAVWNVEYRGVDVPGGGYPGTFADVAAAADLLGREGPALGLKTGRVVAYGHSAGGQLALWLAGRPHIPSGSALWSAQSLPIAGVLSAGGLPDLAQAKAEATDACGVDTVDRLVGPPTSAHPDVYADTSPPRLLPLGLATAQVLFAGALDPISPARFSKAYADRWRRGDHGAVSVIADTGHFELITPTTPAWAQEVRAIDIMLYRSPQPRPR